MGQCAVRLKWMCHRDSASSSAAITATVRFACSRNSVYASGTAAMPASAKGRRTENADEPKISMNGAV